MQWLRQPASLLRLLQRPVWLDAWLRGEEERASLLWRGLPNHVMTQAWTQGALVNVCLCVFNVPGARRAWEHAGRWSPRLVLRSLRGRSLAARC